MGYLTLVSEAASVGPSPAAECQLQERFHARVSGRSSTIYRSIPKIVFAIKFNHPYIDKSILLQYVILLWGVIAFTRITRFCWELRGSQTTATNSLCGNRVYSGVVPAKCLSTSPLIKTLNIYN